MDGSQEPPSASPRPSRQRRSPNKLQKGRVVPRYFLAAQGIPRSAGKGGGGSGPLTSREPAPSLLLPCTQSNFPSAEGEGSRPAARREPVSGPFPKSVAFLIPGGWTPISGGGGVAEQNPGGVPTPSYLTQTPSPPHFRPGPLLGDNQAPLRNQSPPSLHGVLETQRVFMSHLDPLPPPG